MLSISEGALLDMYLGKRFSFVHFPKDTYYIPKIGDIKKIVMHFLTATKVKGLSKLFIKYHSI